jgi:TP901 family phage tail tape measure protein
VVSTAVLYDLIARDSASKTFDKVGRSADKMNKGFGILAKGAAAAGIALVALGAGAAEAAEKATEFQSSMTKIQTQAGASAKDVATLTKQVLKLAPSTQQGPQALSEALYHLKSVGMDNVSAMKALKTASDLAAVGGADLEDTTNALAGAWRTGIKGATNFGQAAATVNAIIGAGNMTMTDFTDALSSGILPTAKTFGLTMGQVGAALALFTDEGVPANSAATRLRMSISLLGAPSGAAEKQLKKIGLTGLELANAMRGKDGIIGAIQLLKNHLDASGLSASQQSQILSHAFGGGKSSSAILSMVNNLDVLKQKQEQVNKSTGKYGAAVKTQRQTAEAQWKILSSSLDTLTIQLGIKLLPPITKFVKYLSQTALPAAEKVGAAIRKLVPVDQIKKDVTTATGVIKGFLKQVGAKDALSSAKKSITGALGLTSKAKAPKPPAPYKPQPTDSPHAGTGKTAPSNLPVGPALQNKQQKSLSKPHAGVGSVAPLVKATPLPTLPHGGSGLSAPLVTPKTAPKPVVSAAQKQGQQLAKTLNSAISSIDWGKVGSILGKGLGSAIDWVVSHASDLSKKIASIFEKIDWTNVGKVLGKTAIPLAIGIITSLFDPLFSVDFWKKHWLDTIIAVISVIPIGKVGDVVGKLLSKVPWGKVGELLGKLLSKIPWGKAGDLAKGIGKLFSDAAKHVGDWFKSIKDALTRQFPKIAGWISDQLTLLPVRIEDLGRLLKKKFSDLLGDVGKWITDHVPGLGSKFTRGLLKVWGRFTFYKTGINLIEGLYNGIVAKISTAYDWVKTNIVDPVVNGVKDALGIHSPSKVFSGIGGNIVSGLKSGILNAALKIGSWVYSHLVSPILTRMAGAGSWLVSKGRSVVTGLKNGVLAGAKSIATWAFTHVAQPLTSRFSAAKSWLLSRGSQLVSGLKNGVLAGAKAIGSWAFSHVAQPLTSRFSAAKTWLTSRGSQLISGLKSGISGAIKGIGTWVKSHIVDPVVNAVKKYFGIHSPSTVFASLGGHLTGGLLKGMAQTGGTQIAKRVFGSLPKALGSLVKKGLVHIEALPGKALKALGGLGGDLLGFLGIGGGSGTSGSNQKIGKTMMEAIGWSDDQWPALKALWNGESGWNQNAYNAASGATGIPQSLPGSKMASAGADWRTNPATQIEWGLGYIRNRYGSPAAAYAQWLARSPHWYDEGGLARGKGFMPKNTSAPERVLSPRQTAAFERLVDVLSNGGGSSSTQPVTVHVHFDDPTLKDLIDVRVDCGLDDLSTALTAGRNE